MTYYSEKVEFDSLPHRTRVTEGAQWKCEGYTQHKPEVVDYCEPFREFLHQILKVYAPKRKFLRNYNYCGLIVKVLLSLGIHVDFIEFCKIYGLFLLQPIIKSEIPRLFFIRLLVF